MFISKLTTAIIEKLTTLTGETRTSGSWHHSYGGADKWLTSVNPNLLTVL
jgi:hypothetical protein